MAIFYLPETGSESVLISSLMSSARQAVQRSESLTGFGNRPVLTPSHQHVLPRGMILRTWGNRRKPVSGISCILCSISIHGITYCGLCLAESGAESRLARAVDGASVRWCDIAPSAGRSSLWRSCLPPPLFGKTSCGWLQVGHSGNRLVFQGLRHQAKLDLLRKIG